MEQMIVSKKKNKKQNKTDYGQEEPIRGSQGENGREWDRRAFGGVFLDAHCYIWNRWAMGPTVQHKEMCVIGSHCCTTELDETLYINYTSIKKRVSICKAL